jgi:ribosomal protein L17
MAKNFVNRINKKLKSGRRSFLGESDQRDRELKQLLKKADIKHDRLAAGNKVKKLLQHLAEDTEDAVQSYFQKWRLYYASILRRAITTNQKPEAVKALLVQPNGHIRIGSSLEEAMMREAAMDLLQQRTAKTLTEARELKLDSCWNANPMDQLTKPVCAAASTAGVIPIPDMEGNYGMPPRYICRCDIMIVSSKWTKLNQGVNQSIETRRKQVVQELMDSPAKKTSWQVGGYTKADGTVVKGYTSTVDGEVYPGRAAGLEHYQETQDKLLVWTDNPVPEYTG